MDELKTIRNWSAALVAAVLVLRLAGFIGSFWTGVGFVALLAVFAILWLAPALRRWVVPLYVAWAAIFIVLPMVGEAFLRNRPVLRDALEARKKEAELVEAERAHPTALRARLGWHEYCNRIEDVQAAWLNAKMEEAESTYAAWLKTARRPQRMLPSLVRDSVFVAMMDTLVAHREACAALVAASSRDEGPRFLGRLRQGLAEKNPIGRFWFWVIAVVLAATLLVTKRSLATKGLGLAGLLALAVVGDSLLYGVRPAAAAEPTALGTGHLPAGVVRGTPADIQSGVLCTADCSNERKLAALSRHTNNRYCSTVTAVRVDSTGKPVEVTTLRSSGDPGCDRAQEAWMAEARWEARDQPYWLAYETVITY